MARKADRVGVRKDQVDVYGRPIAEDFYENLLQDLPSWTDMPVWVGGTEELLPVNDDEPETTPLKADIEYPSEYREQDYFFYRKSPTEENGLAKIRRILGNTIVWNQIISPDALVSSSTTKNGITRSRVTVDGMYMLNMNGTKNQDTEDDNIYASISTLTPYIKANHVYLIQTSMPDRYYTTTYNKLSAGSKPVRIAKCSEDIDLSSCVAIKPVMAVGTTVNDNISIMCIDLTKMYGSTIADNFYNMEQRESGSGVAFLKQYLMLSYYAYDTGRLLSFNGTGLKTVGFNQWDEEWEVGRISWAGQNYDDSNKIRSKNYISCMSNTVYYVSAPYNIQLFFYDVDKQLIKYADSSLKNTTFTTPSGCCYMRFYVYDNAYGTTYKNDICINVSDTSRNGEYEPYVTHTTELPISTFFPTGMKSAGTVYDELLPDKAITRIGAVDLGTLTWGYNSTCRSDN